MTKQCRNPNVERTSGAGSVIWTFGFPSTFVIRASSFSPHPPVFHTSVCHIARSRDISDFKFVSAEAERFLGSLGMTTNGISAAALASPPRARLEFPAETARAAGTRRRSRRSNAYAGRSDKARHVRE